MWEFFYIYNKMSITLTKPFKFEPESNNDLVGNIIDNGSSITVSNVRLSKARQAVGHPNYSLRSLCLSPHINEFAAFRPTIEGFKHQFGWDQQSYDGIVGVGPVYPTSAFGFKLGDFAGYHHKAKPSRLAHNPDPAWRLYGKDTTFYDLSELPSDINVAFYFGEVSPPDVYGTTPALNMYLFEGSNQLQSRQFTPGNVDANNLLWFTNSIDLGLSQIGGAGRTYIVEWGSESPGGIYWYYPPKDINYKFTIKVKSVYVYNFEKQGEWPHNSTLTGEAVSQLRLNPFNTNIFTITLKITVSDDAVEGQDPTWWWVYYSESPAPTSQNTTLIDNWDESPGGGEVFQQDGLNYSAELPPITVDLNEFPEDSNLFIHVFRSITNNPPF